MTTRRLLQESLAAVLGPAGHARAAGDAAALAQRFIELAGKGLHTAQDLAAALKFNSMELDALRSELQRWLDELGTAAAGAIPRNLQMAELRCLLWFETAQARNAPAALPPPAPASDDHLAVFQLLRTLELMMRALVEEQHPDPQRLAQRLRELFPAEAREALKRGAGQPASGLFLKELIRLFVDPAEWARIGRLFDPGAFLSLLRDKRATAASFLEDVRRIRNTVAHLKGMSAVQVQLLQLYYAELVEPVREGFRAGATSVDPARFESAPPAELQAYGRGVLVEIARESRSTRRIAWAGLAVSAVLAAAALPLLLPALRLRFDPDLEFTDAAQRNPADLGSLAVQACEQGRAGALGKLAALTGAAKAMAGADASALHARAIELAAHDPQRLAPCVGPLHAMGWSVNGIGGNSAGSYFGGGSAPSGYTSYLAAHPQGLLGKAALQPAQIRAPALLMAVWQGDAHLAVALLRAGADPKQPAVVDSLPLGQAGDLSVTDSESEARRIGNAELIAALQGHP